MANLLICEQCNQIWSMAFDPLDAPLMLRFAWCPECRVKETLVPIGNVPGVSKPPAYFGATPPPQLPQKPPLLLTYEPQQAAAPVAAPAPARRQHPGVNVLPSGTAAIPMGASEEALNAAFIGHKQGEPITLPPKRILAKYFNGTADEIALSTANYYGENPSKAYARIVAIYLLERGLNTAVVIQKPQGETYEKAGIKQLRRDLRGTLERIAKAESITKSLNNAAYNNDGNLSSDNIKYDRYSKNYKGNRTGSQYLPQPSLVPNLPGKYWEYYIDRDKNQGATALSIGNGRPGVERLFIQVPDYLFYTWNHYGSDVKGPAKSSLTDRDIWAVYSFNANAWQAGLTRT